MSVETNYLCNLVIPGFPKSGTSSLHSYLDMHPQIMMSRHKEPHFFNKNDKFMLGAYEHNRIFETNNQASFYGESSTTYCISEVALDRISRSLREPRVIILLRHPVERVISHYKWMCALGFESEALIDAVRRDGRGFDINKNWNGNYKSYLQFSEYHKYVPPWFDKFGQDRVLIMRTEDLSCRPHQTMQVIFDFLGLPEVSLNAEVSKNRTSDIKATSMPSWLHFLASCTPRAIKIRLKNSQKFKDAIKNTFFHDISNNPKIEAGDLDYLDLQLKRDIQFYNDILSKR